MAATPKRKLSHRRTGKRLASKVYKFKNMDKIRYILADQSKRVEVSHPETLPAAVVPAETAASEVPVKKKTPTRKAKAPKKNE